MRRIQRKRVAGWRMPSNAVYVGRPTKWGNPYVVGGRKLAPVYLLNMFTPSPGTEKLEITESNCLKIFSTYVSLKLSLDPQWLDPLMGKDLACWCPKNKKCHADILLRRLKDVRETAQRS